MSPTVVQLRKGKYGKKLIAVFTGVRQAAPKEAGPQVTPRHSAANLASDGL